MATSIEDFLDPLFVDYQKIHALARALIDAYSKLAAESTNQFLGTPISESVLRPELGENNGSRYLAIDIGGTNLRVGFIELLGSSQRQENVSTGQSQSASSLRRRSHVKRHLEKAWPIGEQLKMDKAQDLFAWIGSCIAEVVGAGEVAWPGELPEVLHMGVTFSFPMIQHTLSEAILMPMGKGFAITSNLDLAEHLLAGYESARNASLPRIKIAAIVNDSVATLVSFAYQYRTTSTSKAVMGLICGTGCNATIPIALRKLLPSKRPTKVKVLDDSIAEENLKIAVNTEWSINGSARPLHELGFITNWDTKLDQDGQYAGFMPFEYMTAGRYLGELGRIIAVDYFTNRLKIPFAALPPKLQQRHGLTTTFLGNLRVPSLGTPKPSILKQLETELPPADESTSWKWTFEASHILLQIAEAIQFRASGMVAAAIIALLGCADEISLSLPPSTESSREKNRQEAKPAEKTLLIGYTGGCIVHFQNYLSDCQSFLDAIVCAEGKFVGGQPKILLKPCHDGGIIGAGILAGTVQKIAHDAAGSSSSSYPEAVIN